MAIGCGKKYPPKMFSNFLSNCSEFQSEILPAYVVILCTQNGIIVNHLAYCTLKLWEL